MPIMGLRTSPDCSLTTHQDVGYPMRDQGQKALQAFDSFLPAR